MCTNLNNAFSPFRSQSFAIYSHQLDALALDLFEKARKAKISVTRDVIRSFGRSTKTTLLKAPATSADVRERLNDFKAGERWAKNFVKRNGLHSSKRLGEAGSIDTEAIEDEIEEIRALCAKFRARRIFNVDETGIQWKVMPRRTYLSNSENRKTARGSKGMTFKDRLSAIVCCNADGTAKVELAIIGKAKEPRCLRGVECALPYFSRANAWSDTATFLKWWREVFLPFVRRFTHEPVLEYVQS